MSLTPDDLDAIRLALHEEWLASDGPTPSPPCDDGAEREVCAGQLDGLVTPMDLPGLRAGHFMHPIRRELFRLAELGPITDIEVTAAALREAGFVGDLVGWLAVARDAVPWRGRASCLDAAGRIRECWRRRRLLERLERLCAGLRCGSHSADEVIEVMRAVTAPTAKTARKSA